MDIQDDGSIIREEPPIWWMFCLDWWLIIVGFLTIGIHVVLMAPMVPPKPPPIQLPPATLPPPPATLPPPYTKRSVCLAMIARDTSAHLRILTAGVLSHMDAVAVCVNANNTVLTMANVGHLLEAGPENRIVFWRASGPCTREAVMEFVQDVCFYAMIADDVDGSLKLLDLHPRLVKPPDALHKLQRDRFPLPYMVK